MHPSRPHLRLALALLALATGTVPLHAQAPAGAMLLVSVRSSSGAGPLPGAVVTLRGARTPAVTGPDGQVRIVGLLPGTRTVQVASPGHRTREFVVELEPGVEFQLPVTMDLGTVALPAIVGTTQRTLGGRLLERTGFFERERTSGGTFLTREDLERLRPRQVSDVLRRYSFVKVEYDRFQQGRAGSRRQTGPVASCRPSIYINNMPSPGYELDAIRPDDIEGIELYSGPSEVPPAFREDSHCGLIVIWTRVN